MSKADLKLDWCSAQAALYACEKWHYSGTMPTPPYNNVGVWEKGKFVGVVIFSRGANNNMLKPFGLSVTGGCELTRIALTLHETPVTKIVSVSIKLLKRLNPGLRLVVSYADPNNGHHGGIYQGGNWIYTGKTSGDVQYRAPDGKVWHSRMISERGFQKAYGKRRAVWKKSQCVAIPLAGKHRYLYPLDSDIRSRIELMRKPYPKRAGSIVADATANHAVEGGSLPTPALLPEGVAV